MGVRFIDYGHPRQTLTQLVGVKNFCDGEKFVFFWTEMKFRLCGENLDFWLVFGALRLSSVFYVYLLGWVENKPLDAK